MRESGSTSSGLRKPDFTIKEVLSSAWDLVGGSKWPIWSPVIAIAAASGAVQYLLTLGLGIDPDYPPVFSTSSYCPSSRMSRLRPSMPVL